MRTVRSLGRPLLTIPTLLILLVAAVPSGAAEAAEDAPTCRPSDEVARVLAEAREVPVRCGGAPACSGDALDVLEAGLAEHPGDLHLTRELLDTWRRTYMLPEARAARREAVLEGYRRAAAEHLDDARTLYFAGLADEDPERALETFLRALEADPGLPWPHLGILASRRAAGDPPTAAEERRRVGAFLDRCPSRVVAAYEVLAVGAHEPYWRERLAAGRDAIRETPAARYRELAATWPALYASTPLEEHDALPALVRRDLERIESLDLAHEDSWWRVRQEGYELLEDEAATERILAERIERFPCVQRVAMARVAAWMKERMPARPASPEERARFAQESLEAADAWLAECPETEEYWFRKLSAVTSGADLSEKDLLAFEAELLERAEAERIYAGNSVESVLADFYLQRGLFLDRVDELVRAGLARDRGRNGQMSANRSLSADLRKLRAQVQESIEAAARRTLFASALAREDTEAAREMLGESAARLDEGRPAANAPEPERLDFLRARATHLFMSGDLATLEGRHEDAAVLYAGSAVHQRRPEPFLAKGKEAWDRAGGSSEGWQSLVEALTANPFTGEGSGLDATAGTWIEKERPLPEGFGVADLAGKTWTRGDFEGKTVFVNLWATWCTPCRHELPYVQQLYERTKERGDVRVVTFNLDENPGAARSYAEAQGFGFPVLLAGGLVEAMGGVVGIPKNWIVDPSAVVRLESGGPSNPETWVDEIIALLDARAAGD